MLFLEPRNYSRHFVQSEFLQYAYLHYHIHGIGNMILMFYIQVWSLLINGLFWSGNSSGYLIFVNDFILHRTGMSEDEVALGITIIGNYQ